MTPLPPALLLDLDDTILWSDAAVEPAWRQVCEKHAARLPGCEAVALFEGIRGTAGLFWSDSERHRRGRLDLVWARRWIVGAAFERLGLDAPEIAQALADDYSLLREDLVQPFPGAIDVLCQLRERRVRLALVTNGASHMQRAKIERFELEPFFDAILIEGEWGAGKPDPSIFSEALRRLGDVLSADAWMVGDNLDADIAGAQSIGVHAIWNDFDHRGLPDTTPVQPDRIVHHLGDLL